jgi:hypothetical protein
MEVVPAHNNKEGLVEISVLRMARSL